MSEFLSASDLVERWKMPDWFVTAQDTASRYGVTAWNVNKLHRDGDLPCFHLWPKSTRFRVRDVLDVFANLSRTKSESRALYFLQANRTGLVKIGVTDDFKKRYREIQLANADEIRLLGRVKGGAMSEARLHREFADTRHHGEWFLPTDRIFARIDAVTKGEPVIKALDDGTTH